MNSSALTASNIVLAIVAFLSLAVAFLQFVSDQRPSLSAKLYGYPHHHLFDLTKSPLDEREIILKNSFFRQEAAKLHRVSGVYRALISNEGEAAAKDVNVNIDGGIGVMVLRAGKKEVIDGDSVTLGDIKPGEELELIAWTIFSAGLHTSRDPGITITYDNGVVQVKKMYEIEGALRFIHEHDLHVYFVISLWAVLAVVSFAKLKSRENSKSKTTAESKGDTESETEDDDTRP